MKNKTIITILIVIIGMYFILFHFGISKTEIPTKTKTKLNLLILLAIL
jgi:hypothetical protein